MTSEEKSKCGKIIREATIRSTIIPDEMYHRAEMPFVEVNITMIIRLGTVFCKEISKNVAEYIFAVAYAQVIPKVISQIEQRKVLQLLVKWIPILGRVAYNVAITQKLGWYVANEFAT